MTHSRRLFAVLALLLCDSLAAQALEEVLVTAQRLDSEQPAPGTFLRKTGDFLLLQVYVSNDTRNEDQRKEEIYATLRDALALARRDRSIELSVIDDNDFVLPLKVDSATISLRSGKRPDTSATTISVKTAIPTGTVDGQGLISKLKDFVNGIKGTGRTELVTLGDVSISIVGPNQYRGDIIKLFANDVKSVTSALGPEYKVIATGIDKPVTWGRVGLLDLGLYIPYEYVVVPTSVNSYTKFSEYD